MQGLTAIAGVRVGHHTDSRRPTGCTVVLLPPGTVGGIDVRGAAPGTRETELLDPVNAVREVHAVLLAGGSAFGLDAASGVMRWLEEHDIGVQVGPAVNGHTGRAVRIPIVPAAILYDLWLGDPRIRPDAAAGYAACEAASTAAVSEGNVGAGAGATVGKLFGLARAMRGGLGSASATVQGIRIAALVAVNAIGDVVDPATGSVVAGARTPRGDALLGSTAALLRGERPTALQLGTATTLGIVVTDAILDKAAAKKLAQMAQDGLARSIDPVHTQTDGDVVFALATGGQADSVPLTVLGAVAARVLASAVLRAVLAARRLEADATAGLPYLPVASDFAASDPSPHSST